MSEEPKDLITDDELNTKITEQMLPLRDRIIKIETIINYHDKEFQNVKQSLNDLSDTLDKHQVTVLERLEQYNKTSMDVSYSHYREQTAKTAAMMKEIEANKTNLTNFINKWKLVASAVWFTIVLLIGLGTWLFATGKYLGIIDINQIPNPPSQSIQDPRE